MGERRDLAATRSTSSTSRADCDGDTLLVTRAAARPGLPPRHPHLLRRRATQRGRALAFLAKLEAIIEQRATDKPEGSYTARLLAKGITRIAQKVGEEGVELALAGVTDTDEKVIEESADLLFHLLVLLRARGVPLERVIRELGARHKK